MSAKGHDIKSWKGVQDVQGVWFMSTLDVFDIFTRDYARERFETMSLQGLAARCA